ncbi:hypothetical protein HJC23_012582 [Cyclotella cryptica]|uniref:Mitochondrial splicing suppressor 51-like C-terminal domain-containing protein n=1 Tax=Cyclotella cryptica TaxID=29204 RepID=A0ABD3NY10_9STRA|eukprot:CCRYP_019052-RA/>CCRYP_019052-RA protein AED:0.41 eAED:0.41 QI:0/-1/0/1/-1/1/1/0/506
MDLLASLGLDSLPEQSTRLTSHPGVIDALENNADARLGFNLCCNCGTRLNVSDDGVNPKSAEKASKSSSKFVQCKGCHRVKYCCHACCKADAEEVTRRGNSNFDEETAFGHSALLCSLLRLCNDDEDAEGELFNEHGGKMNNSKSNSQKQTQAKEAAMYRVQTERESYPATLFNILAESPDWFMDAMTRRIRNVENSRSSEKHRRGKRDRVDHLPNTRESVNSGKRQLVVHIVGASIESELWGWNGKKEQDGAAVLQAYAEASTNILTQFESVPITLESLRLVFIGPDCPKSCKCNVPIPDSKTVLIIETHCCNYGDHNQNESLESLSPPDAIVFFNPGFSCPDYDWSKALSAASTPSKSGAAGPVPFLVTTNTEMEGFADIKCLLDGRCIDATSLPQDILEALDYPTPKSGKHETEDEDKSFFFSENPYHGLRVRQSGTMANDIYVKSRWMFGGLFRKAHGSNKRKTKEDNDKNEGREVHRHAQKKHRGGKNGGNNSKKKNPALI